MSSMLSTRVAIIVVDDLLHRALTHAAESPKVLSIPCSMPKSMHQRLDALKGQRPGSHTRSSLHRIPQKPSSTHRCSIPAAHWRILRITLHRRITLLRLRIALRWRRRWRSRRFIPSQQTPQKTRSMLRLTLLLLQLLKLGLHLRQLCLRLLQRILLHQHCLRQNIERIRVLPQPLLQHLFRIHVLLCKLRLLHAINQISDHFLFLRSHRPSLFLDCSLIPAENPRHVHLTKSPARNVIGRQTRQKVAAHNRTAQRLFREIQLGCARSSHR